MTLRLTKFEFSTHGWIACSGCNPSLGAFELFLSYALTTLLYPSAQIASSPYTLDYSVDGAKHTFTISTSGDLPVRCPFLHHLQLARTQCPAFAQQRASAILLA